ncbi:MAG TPA: DUF2442 domain-containing protein [Ilumatobacter sp.]|nr:DUF2442 domain-containing protein [Ilumatobacter sp.]
MRPKRVIEASWLGGRVVRVVFADGLVRELDFAGALPGILESIDTDEAFAAVGVDQLAGTVAWPGGIDLDPDVLRGDAQPVSTVKPLLVREYRLQATGS